MTAPSASFAVLTTPSASLAGVTAPVWMSSAVTSLHVAAPSLWPTPERFGGRTSVVRCNLDRQLACRITRTIAERAPP